MFARMPSLLATRYRGNGLHLDKIKREGPDWHEVHAVQKNTSAMTIVVCHQVLKTGGSLAVSSGLGMIPMLLRWMALCMSSVMLP